MSTEQEPAGPPASADGDPAIESRTLQRLWGREPRPRRGPKPALSVARIVDAAFSLADTEGLAAVSMARVAESLGYSPMALYRHVTSKDELLVLLADAVSGQLPDLPDEGTWRDGLEAWTRAQIDLGQRHSWYLDLPITTAPPGPKRLAWIDQAIGVMAELDLDFGEKLGIVGLLSQHVLGETRVLVETERAAREKVRADAGIDTTTADEDLDPRAVAAANPYADFETVLSRLADPAQFPHIASAARAWDPAGTLGTPDDDDIGFGLDIILDGIEVYVRRRTGASPPTTPER